MIFVSPTIKGKKVQPKKRVHLKKSVSENRKLKSEKLNESLERARDQLLTYGSQIQEYLEKVEANVDGYKFSVERQDDGLSIDIAFRATVLPRTSGKPAK